MLKGKANIIQCPDHLIETVKFLLRIIDKINNGALSLDFQYIYLDKKIYTLDGLRNVLGEPRTIQRHIILINRIIQLMIEEEVLLAKKSEAFV